MTRLLRHKRTGHRQNDINYIYRRTNLYVRSNRNNSSLHVHPASAWMYCARQLVHSVIHVGSQGLLPRMTMSSAKFMKRYWAASRFRPSGHVEAHAQLHPTAPWAIGSCPASKHSANTAPRSVRPSRPLSVVLEAPNQARLHRLLQPRESPFNGALQRALQHP